MLTIQECRKYVGKSDLTDEKLEEVRDVLYVFAHKLIEDFLNLEDDPVSSNYPHEMVAIVPIPRHNMK
ncbi:MAG: hypothetical protein WA058_04095 [Minisyncoccia bacterium]